MSPSCMLAACKARASWLSAVREVREAVRAIAVS
jgi:hypothetical protein